MHTNYLGIRYNVDADPEALTFCISNQLPGVANPAGEREHWIAGPRLVLLKRNIMQAMYVIDIFLVATYLKSNEKQVKLI